MLPLLDLDIPWEEVDGTVWGVFLQFIVLFYSFIGLAVICDDHLCPALDTLCEKWQISEDVAGATFMAFGSAAPEIVIAAVSTAQSATSEDGADEDATTLGVSSVVGSGLIAFSLIPAVCALSAPSTLELKRRPLLRDQFAYLISLLCLMYIIEDGYVHTWEAAILLVVYILYLLVIVFARSVRVWYIREVLGEMYVPHNENKTLLHDDDDSLVDEEDVGLDQLVMQDEYAQQQYGAPQYIEFRERPLGFRCQPGEDNKNAFVATVVDNEFQVIGSQIMEINATSCHDIEFSEIEGMLKHLELPLTIKFQQPPQDSVDQWTKERVKQWWQHGLPPACQAYISIVDDCHLDGSDLLDLDWEMLAEFGVKKIHGMKILKAIKKLMPHRLLDTEIQRVVKRLELWEVNPKVVSDLRNFLEGKKDGSSGAHLAITDGEHHGDHHNNDHSGKSVGSGSDSEDHHPTTCFGKFYHYAVLPLEKLFTHIPECEMGTPGEDWYLVTFAISFVWVAVFSFLLSSIVERWVDVTGMPMAFFGLILVSVAAQVPDTLESLAVARKGYGGMAVANCLGTQTINIGIGLGLPWLITSSCGVKTELKNGLIVPCYFMLAMIVGGLCIYSTDVIAGYKKIYLTKLKAWLLIGMYFACVGGYGAYLASE